MNTNAQSPLTQLEQIREALAPYQYEDNNSGRIIQKACTQLSALIPSLRAAIESMAKSVDEKPYFGFDSLGPEGKGAYRIGYQHGVTDAEMEGESNKATPSPNWQEAVIEKLENRKWSDPTKSGEVSDE